MNRWVLYILFCCLFPIPIQGQDTAEEAVERLRSLRIIRNHKDGYVEGKKLVKRFPDNLHLRAWFIYYLDEAGLRDIGENRVDELQRKRAVLNHLAVNWHMIGHVQRRKAGPAARLAGLVHSVDSLRLAEKLSRLGEAEGRRVPVLVQLNVSGEATKGGFPEAEALDGVGAVAALGGLRVLGLMTMAPFVAEEAVLRSTFRKTREVMEAAAGTPGVEGRELSMGMSNDYEIAVEEGSTIVRLGTTLLGARPG